MKIPFNKPFLTGNELKYIEDAVNQGKLSGNGKYTKKCHELFENRYGFKKCLLTSSCTDALEMSAILIDIKPGDEVIMPSYTFVSTANAFILRGATIKFADSSTLNPNIEPERIEELISSKTKAVVVVHYAGIACDMKRIKDITDKYNLFLIEDAAQAIDSFHNRIPLGKIGDLSTFSFHETKNIISGEGGMLVVNNPDFIDRAEIIWEKGTNRAAFFRGEIDKYGWVDIGSSFLTSEVVAAFLYAQLEKLEEIQKKRIQIWRYYYKNLIEIERSGQLRLPQLPKYATNNAHMFYVLCNNNEVQQKFIEFMKSRNILAVFHYLSLHKSPYFKGKHDNRELINSDRFTDCLVRLPLFYDLTDENQSYIVENIYEFFLNT